MRTLAILAASLFAVMTPWSMNVSAETLVNTSNTWICPKCGKVHVGKPTSVVQAQTYTTPTAQPTATLVSATPVVQASAMQYSSVPIARTSVMRATGGVVNVLASLNAQRARQGIGSLRYDPHLQSVAERRAARMAASGYKNHPSGSFSPGRYEGVGWSSSYSPSGVSACFTSDRRMTIAGAAMATGRDGVYFCVVYR